MKDIVEKYRPEGATIIVSDPKTGFILGLCNYPTFDPNTYWKFPLENLKNSAISDVMEPGSTFKAVTISAALEENVINPEMVFDCGAETYPYRGKELRLPKNDEKMGKMTVREIIARSSNKGAAEIGMTLGEEKLYAYASAFGYGKSTGLGLTGESGGILWPVRKWDGLTITRLPMGHSVAATPLQIHCAMGAVANDGVLMTPVLIKRVYDERNNTILEFTPRPKRQVISPATSRLMRTLLIRTVSPDGTAPRAQIKGYEVAGKTGTTQKIIDGRYSTSHHIASFSGFFPARDPQLQITVIIDNPHTKGVGFGGLVSAPAFKAIATRLIQHLNIAPVEETSTEKPSATAAATIDRKIDKKTEPASISTSKNTKNITNITKPKSLRVENIPSRAHQQAFPNSQISFLQKREEKQSTEVLIKKYEKIPWKTQPDSTKIP
jgi:cell division protein FtsI/penicillin-binding protein 2